MESWASIVKRNGSCAGITQTTQVEVSRNIANSSQGQEKQEKEVKQNEQNKMQLSQKEKKQQQLEIYKVHDNFMKKLKEEDESENKMPLYRYIVRPDTHPFFAPEFKDLFEKCHWEREQWRLNQEYSSLVHDERVAAWEKKNNWFSPPLMTEVTEEQKKMGFIPESQPSLYKFGYLCPHNSEEKRHEYLHFLMRLLYNRSEQVCACKTVGEFEKVYLEAMHFTRCSDEEWTPAELKRESKTALNALWVLSTKANLFPGKQVKPRAAPAPISNVSVSTGYHYPPNYMTQYLELSKNKRYDVIGVERGETGICGVKDAKTLGNSAPIRWYMTPAEMRNLKTFNFVFQRDPREVEEWYDSDDDFGFGDY
jgi:hypothetical protein